MRCPICNENKSHLLFHFDFACDSPVLDYLKKEVTDWTPTIGVCSRCADQAQLDAWSEFKQVNYGTEVNGYKILPIPVRLNAHPCYTGKGVTIAFIDSGFYPHPDIVDRILVVKDIPEVVAPMHTTWHGTMTSVVGAGNGKLSGGQYKSLAPDAKLVLLKVADNKGHISGENISKAIYWAIEHKERYNIRILNLSVTDDWETSYRENEVDIAIEKAVGKGIVVVVAAGNDENAFLKAPANSPHAITVGGLDDRNTLHPLTQTIYHSTFGETIDGIHKPDLIAPAIWIPAPVLPYSQEQNIAKALFSLLVTDDEVYFRAKLHNYRDLLSLDYQLWQQPIDDIKETIQAIISKRQLISPHYQHSDGTSFAAPIVSSLVAQLLEANPKLSPVSVRVILQRSARKLKDIPADRQGFGVIHPLSATYLAEKEHRWLPNHFMPLINQLTETIEFQLHENAAAVALSGDFIDWQVPGLTLQQAQENVWQINRPLLPKGTYRYKYLLDNQKWIPDTANILRESDGHDGFNSKLIIE